MNILIVGMTNYEAQRKQHQLLKDIEVNDSIHTCAIGDKITCEPDEVYVQDRISIGEVIEHVLPLVNGNYDKVKCYTYTF